MGKLDHTHNWYVGTYEKHSKVFSSTFHIKSSLTFLPRSPDNWVILALCVFGHKGDLGKLGPNTSQIMYRNTPNVIQNLQLHILHQARLYFSVKALRGLSYTCFTGTWVIEAIQGNWAQIPKIMCRATGKFYLGLQLHIHIKWGLTLVSKPSESRVMHVSQVFGDCDNLGKAGTNIPYHVD